MTTYADLLTATAEHLRRGNADLATDGFWSVGDAHDAIGDFHGLLQAIAAHTHRLLWPAKALRPGMNRDIAALSPTERASADLAAAIQRLVGAATPHPSQLAPLTTPWRHAAVHLRAASDLVATHFHPDGGPRTPDAAHADRRALDTGLADLGHLAATILAVEEPLALRALQAGMTRTAVAKHLPGLGHLADLARAAGAGHDHLDAGARAALGSLGPTWAPIRIHDPLAELSDRMHRVRLATWDLDPRRAETLATLRDVTTIGIAVHAHAAAFHGARPATAPDPAPSARGAQALVVRGRAWQALHRDLAQFLTLAPPHAAVRDDLLALARLLPTIAPVDARANTAARADPRARRIGAELAGAVATMTQVGDHSATAFSRLAEAGALHLPGRDLPRDLVTDHPDLARARLQGDVVRAPAALTDTVLAAYDVVRAHPIHPFGATAITPTHLERGLAAMNSTLIQP